MRRAKEALLVVSVALLAAACGGASARAAEQRWSWAQPHARVLETGDLQWAPHRFVFEAGPSVRYIDHDGGDDANPGTTKDTAWKHHPWDAEATDNAAECSGIHTYVFKRGVVYRGALLADESGRPGDPIRLTSDPSWGQDEAAIYGSLRLAGGWTRCDASRTPGIPNPELVWYRDIGTAFRPYALWMTDGGDIARIAIARDPNWQVSNPDDVKSEWHEWQDVQKETVPAEDRDQAKVWGVDAEHLTAADPNAYAGATVWTEYVSVMGTPYANPVEAYDPQRHAIRFGGPWGDASHYAPILRCRYFLENHPSFLDAPGEYYYAAEGPRAGRLHVRLPGDRDPNTAVLEAAQRLTLLDIRSQSHIHVTGLTFRFQNVAHLYDRWWTISEVDPACVKVLGDCVDIRVSNCRFEHVVTAVYARAGSMMDEIAVTDNEIHHTDCGAIDLGRGSGELRQVAVLRNQLAEIGHRPMRAHHGHALVVEFATLADTAGNILDRCYGAGLFVHGGKGGRGQGAVPLSRVLMHHNKVTDSLLNTNDWGGIEFWQGGPAYIYSNVSGNPGGYWHWSHVMRGKTAQERNHATARFGFAYYLDGGFKCYVFNNIAWGRTSDLTSPLCPSAAFHEVIGFLNSIFNNTAYRFAAPFRRQVPEGGRGYYLGNLLMDASEMYFRHADIDRPEDAHLIREGEEPYPVDTLAYAENVFVGPPRYFGAFDRDVVHSTMEEFRTGLEARKALVSQTGSQADVSPVRGAEAHDFRPAPDLAVAGRGVKHFVPWGLYGVVGEWHFYRHPADPSRILDDSWYMTEEYAGREMYRRVPRFDLKAVGVAESDFVRGMLEDWTDGALSLGPDKYCVLTDAEMRKDFQSRGRTYSGQNRQTVDMGTNNFLIEVVLKMTPGKGGYLVDKSGPWPEPAALAGEPGAPSTGEPFAGLPIFGVGENVRPSGYRLFVDGDGRPYMGLCYAGNACWRKGSVAVNDGEWHHLIAEVDRAAPEGIAIYVDGKRADAEWSGTMPAPDVSLSNAADFLVGRTPFGSYFDGALDFLRIARGTLKDARTSIEELCEWEFNGPFLKDFAGKDRAEGRGDAGALCR